MQIQPAPLRSRDYNPHQDGWAPRNFDAIEVHGVEATSPEPGIFPVIEVNDESPEFYSVYLHRREGGVDCVGDFSLLADAKAYALELSLIYAWPVTFLCPVGQS